MSEVIYMPLQGEGTECWRPVHADHASNDVYEVAVDLVPAGENWLFPPHSRVRCREHVFSDGQVGLVAFEVVK